MVSIWSPAERAAWRLPSKATVSQWADRNRYLDSRTSAAPGRWRTDRTPYLREIMDAFGDHGVREITLMTSSQVGKTESLLNMIGYVIDQDPGPALMVYPRHDDAKGVSYNRIKPMIELSPPLRARIPPLSDDITKTEYRFGHMSLEMAGSNSPADLARRSIKYLFMDELDKFPPFSGREADPVKLAEERTRTFPNRKRVKCSTPTTRRGYIYREFEKSDRRRYYVPCPHCGHHQVFRFGGAVKWPDGSTAEQVSQGRLAWYECEECRGRIEDRHKASMLKAGVWAPDGCTVTRGGMVEGDIPKTAHRGYWLNCLYSPWLTFSEIAAEFLESKGNPETLMNFVNSWLAELWEEKVEETPAALIESRAMDYAEGSLMPGTVVLTGGVDVQKACFYVVIRGWAVGERSWLVRHIRVESWEEVENVLFLTKYPFVSSGKPALSVRLACVDSGYRADEVYDFCRKWREVARPTKGHDRLAGAPFRVNEIFKHAQTGRPIPFAVTLFHLDTSHYKDKLARLIHAAQNDESHWHIFRGAGQDYIEQMGSEHKIIERNRTTGQGVEVWKQRAAGLANHYWDCETMAVAAADMLHVSAMRAAGEVQTYRPQERDSQIVGAGRHSTGWMRNRTGWMGGRGAGSWVRR
jgi:phage terminase large subunit GpA-like protein